MDSSLRLMQGITSIDTNLSSNIPHSKRGERFVHPFAIAAYKRLLVWYATAPGRAVVLTIIVPSDILEHIFIPSRNCFEIKT